MAENVHRFPGRRHRKVRNPSSEWNAYVGVAPADESTGKTETEDLPKLTLERAALPDPSSIPPREWLYGTQLVRGFVSVIVAPGGVGKSSYAMGVGLSLVTQRSLLGEHVFEQVNVAIINLDDPMQELNRRVAALMILHKTPRETVAERLFLNSGEKRGLYMAEIDDDGFSVVCPDEQGLIDEINANNISVIICDPFAESHGLEENSNPQMIQAAAAWRRVAQATGCAVLLVHHVRKGELDSIDAARGAKALTDSARVGLIMSTMSETDAQTFGVEVEERWQYVRVDDAKRNMAAARQAKWLKLESVSLGNTGLNRLYPKGDSVQAITSWQPTPVWAQHSDAVLNEVLDVIAAGPAPGVLYGLDRRGNSNRWAGDVLMDQLDINQQQAEAMLQTWLKNGLIMKKSFEDKKKGRTSPGIVVVDVNRPGPR